ncbi:FAD-dependent oxidoreductase [Alphaproteobacteria bacterium]|nr:FAD-dependent oxidoreductase [Alphaproteobacteria bacterium]
MSSSLAPVSMARAARAIWPRPVPDFALAPGKFAVALRMAKAAMEVRGEIVKDSPERVRAIQLLYPIFRDGPYKEWQVDLAFKVLGGFGPADVPLKYKRIPRDQCGALPFISEIREPERLKSVAMFTEYMFEWPERLCIDAVLDAEDMGAVIRNYTRASLVARDDAGIWRVKLSDEFGSTDQAIVSAPIVLNMAGIWVDDVNQVRDVNAKRLILVTKGSHIVVKLPPAFKDFGIAMVNSLGEPHYCLPSQGGYHHIGPTETIYDGNVDDIKVDTADRAFLLGETNSVLPGLKLKAEDIAYTWAGVRPLGFDAKYPKGKRSVELHDLSSQGLDGVYAMTAGPLMTHRTAGRDIAALIGRKIPPSHQPCDTNFVPRKFPENQNSPALLVGNPRVKLSDIAHAAAKEHALSLADILISRTGALYDAALSVDEMRRAAEAASIHLGWDGQETQRQIEMLRARLRNTYEMG